jgi:hypothetical protein
MVIAVETTAEAAAENSFPASKLESGDIDLITDVEQVVATFIFLISPKTPPSLYPMDPCRWLFVV